MYKQTNLEITYFLAKLLAVATGPPLVLPAASNIFSRKLLLFILIKFVVLHKATADFAGSVFSNV